MTDEAGGGTGDVELKGLRTAGRWPQAPGGLFVQKRGPEWRAVRSVALEMGAECGSV